MHSSEFRVQSLNRERVCIHRPPQTPEWTFAGRRPRQKISAWSRSEFRVQSSESPQGEGVYPPTRVDLRRTSAPSKKSPRDLVQSSEFRVQSSESRVQSSEFRVQSLRERGYAYRVTGYLTLAPSPSPSSNPTAHKLKLNARRGSHTRLCGVQTS